MKKHNLFFVSTFLAATAVLGVGCSQGPPTDQAKTGKAKSSGTSKDRQTSGTNTNQEKNAKADLSKRAGGQSPFSYVIRGDLSANYARGEIVAFLPKKKAQKGAATTPAAGGMSPAKTSKAGSTITPAKSAGSTITPAQSAGLTPADSANKKQKSPHQALKKSLNIVFEAKLEDGKFEAKGELNEITPVYFYVLDGYDHQGRLQAPIKGAQFILEPGTLTMKMDKLGNSLVQGKYNDAVFNAWKDSPEYKAALKKKSIIWKSVAGESREEKAAREADGMKNQKQLLDLETNARKKAALSHPDHLVRELTIKTTWLGGDWLLQAAYGIRAEDADNAWVKSYIARYEAAQKQRNASRNTARVGTSILDFDAKTISDQTVSLKQVRSRNKYVLLEFWASWCGPCRKEIPNLKRAYTAYHDKGFEIFSFTVDDDKKAWAAASKQEQLPWIDAGFGFQSKPARLYNITGVPANYLVDGATGKVVARDLRGEALDSKLKELLD